MTEAAVLTALSHRPPGRPPLVLSRCSKEATTTAQAGGGGREGRARDAFPSRVVCPLLSFEEPVNFEEDGDGDSDTRRVCRRPQLLRRARATQARESQVDQGPVTSCSRALSRRESSHNEELPRGGGRGRVVSSGPSLRSPWHLGEGGCHSGVVGSMEPPPTPVESPAHSLTLCRLSGVAAR